MTAPRTTARQYGRGSAAKQDAIRKGKVAASKAKLDALIARQEAENTCNRGCETLGCGHA